MTSSKNLATIILRPEILEIVEIKRTGQIQIAEKDHIQRLFQIKQLEIMQRLMQVHLIY